MHYKVVPFDKWQYMCGTSFHHDPLIRCRIDFDGHLDEDVLTRAVTLSLKTIPLLGCCFDGKSVRARWVDKGFTGKDMVSVTAADEDVEKQVYQYMAGRLDFAVDPQLKVTVVRSHDSDIMCVLISHIVCDAAGFKEYLYLLGRLYTALYNGEEPPPQAFLDRGTQPLFVDTTWQERRRILRSAPDSHVFPDRNQIGINFDSGEPRVYMENRVVFEDGLAALKAHGQAQGATVNDGFMALYSRAFCKNTATQHVWMPSTIDLRKYIPEGTPYGITNYTTNCLCDVLVKPEDSLADTIAQISRQMWTYKSGKDPLKPVLLWNRTVRWVLHPILRMVFAKVIQLPIVFYSNFGIIDAALLRFADVPVNDAYLTAGLRPRPYAHLNLSTFQNRCTVTCNFIGSDLDQQFFVHVLDDMCAEVAELTQDQRQDRDSTLEAVAGGFTQPPGDLA